MKKSEIINRYGSPADEDAATTTVGIGTVPGLESIPGLMSSLRQCDTVDQADAVVQMKACQIAQTGFAGSGVRATAEQREWAAYVDRRRRESEAAQAVPGACKGCNSNPCRCWA